MDGTAPQTQNQGLSLSLAMKMPSFARHSTTILTIPDPETIRIPSGAQIGLDGPLKTQCPRAIRRVLETVLDDEAGPADPD